jgi:hypothetical protein
MPSRKQNHAKIVRDAKRKYDARRKYENFIEKLKRIEQERMRTQEMLEKAIALRIHEEWQKEYNKILHQWGLDEPWMTPSMNELCTLVGEIEETGFDVFRMLPAAPLPGTAFNREELRVAQKAAKHRFTLSFWNPLPPVEVTLGEAKVVDAYWEEYYMNMNMHMAFNQFMGYVG